MKPLAVNFLLLFVCLFFWVGVDWETAFHARPAWMRWGQDAIMVGSFICAIYFSVKVALSFKQDRDLWAKSDCHRCQAMRKECLDCQYARIDKKYEGKIK